MKKEINIIYTEISKNPIGHTFAYNNLNRNVPAGNYFLSGEYSAKQEGNTIIFQNRKHDFLCYEYVVTYSVNFPLAKGKAVDIVNNIVQMRLSHYIKMVNMA